VMTWRGLGRISDEVTLVAKFWQAEDGESHVVWP
jgi:hypothetical protein